MFAESKVLSFFPTGVWTHVLAPEDYEPLNPRLKTKIYELLAALPDSAQQTRNDLQNLPEFEELVAFMRQATKGVLDFLQLEYGDFQITGCWANVQEKGAPEHGGHSHPNNFLSGVYYVQVQEGGNVITFQDPRPQVYIMAPKRKQFTEHNSRDVHLTVRTGSLIVFPAWLIHSVQPNESETDRISISFNAMLSAYAEDISPPQWRPREDREAGVEPSSGGRPRNASP